MRGDFQADALVLENSIVFDNTGADDEIAGFSVRDVRSTDVCEDGVPHPDGDGAAPNSNVCVAPALAGDKGDEDVDQTAASPTIDAGDNELRVFRIRIRVPRGKKARSAVVRVNNKKVKVVRGKRLRGPVRLRGLPKGKFTVKITVRLTNGKKITGKRTYHTCIPKLPGDGPPKV